MVHPRPLPWGDPSWPIRHQSVGAASMASATARRAVRRLGHASALGAIDTAWIKCDAGMRRPWWMPIPLQIRMSHHLGVAFVHEIRIGRGALSLPFGLDAFVDGRGRWSWADRPRPGRSSTRAPRSRCGAKPSSSRRVARQRGRRLGVGRRPDRAPDRPETRGRDPHPRGLPPPHRAANLLFRRPYKGAGPRTRWYGAWCDWVVGPEGVLAPRRMPVRWADESHAWLTIRVTRLAVNSAPGRNLRPGRRRDPRTDDSPALPPPV